MNQQPIKKAPHAAECFCSDCTLRKGGLQDEPASHADENGSLEPEVAAEQKEPPAQTTANGADEAPADEKAQDAEQSASPGSGPTRPKLTRIDSVAVHDEYCKEGARLLPHHRQLIIESAIKPEIARERGYRTIFIKRELNGYGFGPSQQITPTLLLPLYDPKGKPAGWQHRPDFPRWSKDNPPKPIKYETPSKWGMRIDVHPSLSRKPITQNGPPDFDTTEVPAPIVNPAIPLFITEGIRKADSATSYGLCCIALLGVWNWRGTNAAGGKVALADWEDIALNNRVVYIAFDSDVMTNRHVHAALVRLQAFLTQRGAIVRFIYLPPGLHGEKVGLDDWIAAREHEGKSAEEIRTDLIALAVDELRKPDGLDDDSGDDTVKRPFRLTDKEVLYAEESDDGSDKWVKVCSRLKIAAQTCNERNEDWGRLLEFPDNKGLLHYWAMPTELLGRERSAYESELYRLGLTIAPGPKSSYRLKEYIQTQGDQSSFVRSVSTLGWHGKSFVYPDQIFGAAGDEPIVHHPSTQ
jgi:hypothetical protein